MSKSTDTLGENIDQLDISRLQGRLWFLASGVVRVRVSEPDNASKCASSSEQSTHDALQRNCWAQMPCGRSMQHFDVKFAGTDGAPAVEVVIHKELVQANPLLRDVAGSTLADGDVLHETEFFEEQVAGMDLPCSVWGLVTLLLLLEVGPPVLGMEEWMGGVQGHPGLPMQTLEVRLR